MPWCGHCKSMKPDYDRLGAEYAHSSSVAVVDVNCEEESELCQANGVQGYPTIKYYVGGEESKYEGGRDYASLKTFVDEKLAKRCDLSDAASTCSEKAIDFSTKWMFKSLEEAQAEIKRLEGMKVKQMTPELRSWLNERLQVLQQIEAQKKNEDL